ncbi:lipopolysaccharide biosynthesis protein [Brevibacterium marinum]|uniref:O-antigen/teichoic acid export membrane protein n=1 Tax=Brevibacterium marinum TaxID=418643 RepID=A0A846RPS4_9MICO|nr:hypothetical protein [Brevibacterium marinum]NJC55944.1 O-antigen/teichoic acid export membrane protein [Brevibacterium marinum]
MPKGPFMLVTVGNIVSAAAQWYIVWLFARQDGAHAVGQYSGLLAILTPIFITTQLGLRNLYISLQRHVRWPVYLGLRLTTVLLSVVAGLAVIWHLGGIFDWQLAMAILLIKVSDSVADLFFARLQKAERLSAFGILLIADAFVTTAVVTFAMLATSSVIVALWGAAAVSILAAFSTGALGLRSPDPMAPGPAASQQVLSRFRTVPGDVGALLRAGVPLSLMQGIYSLLSYVPLGVVGLFGAPDDVGRYASAAYLVVFANLVGASAETVLLPGYRRRYQARGRIVLLRSVTATSVVTFIALTPLVVLAVLTGPRLLVSVYGADFSISRTAVLFLALAACITMPTYMISAMLLILNRYWATTVIGAASVLCVLVSGVIAGFSGMEAVEAGCLAVFVGSSVRYVGELVLCRLSRWPGQGSATRSANAEVLERSEVRGPDQESDDKARLQ